MKFTPKESSVADIFRSYDKKTGSSKLLLRASSVLKAFLSDETELSFVDIVNRVGIPKASAHRILESLVECGFLEQSKKNGKYNIGVLLHILGSLYLQSADLAKAAEPVLEAINEIVGHTVSVAIYNKGYITRIIKIGGRSPLNVSVSLGIPTPAYCSSVGKALLSELSETEIDNLYHDEILPKFTSKTITSKTELIKQLNQIKKSGIAFANEEAYEGVAGIASLIRDIDGKGIASIGIGIPAYGLTEATYKRFATLVKMGADIISFRLGYVNNNAIYDVNQLHIWWNKSTLVIDSKNGDG